MGHYSFVFKTNSPNTYTFAVYEKLQSFWDIINAQHANTIVVE